MTDYSTVKSIACSTNGIWSKIPDNDDIAKYMSSYYKLFAMGLGDNANKNFVAWVEPYPFATSGDMGTTISAPVYDRSVSPNMFIGVIATDFTVEFMKEIVGGSDSYNEVLKALVRRSTAICPKYTLNECEL